MASMMCSVVDSCENLKETKPFDLYLSEELYSRGQYNTVSLQELRNIDNLEEYFESINLREHGINQCIIKDKINQNDVNNLTKQLYIMYFREYPDSRWEIYYRLSKHWFVGSWYNLSMHQLNKK